jgi:flagellar motility protein MotE (MotC chaperone)
MAMAKKKNMTRDEAAELYRDLQRAMGKMGKAGAIEKMRGMKKEAPKASASTDAAAKAIAQSIRSAMARDENPRVEEPKERPMRQRVTYAEAPEDRMPEVSAGVFAERNWGRSTAIALVLLCAAVNVGISALQYSGIGKVENAEAAMTTSVAQSVTPFSREEIKVLTALDARRAELSERAKKFEDREEDLKRREQEFSVKLVQLRQLTDALRNDKDKDDKKRQAQLEQLANVYGSMSPQEAAALMEQLDVTIALSLLERMPEKRIGQILALMTKERALMITRMLTERGSEMKG